MAIDAISTLFPPTAGGAPDGAAAEPAAPGFGTLVEGLVAHTEGTVRTANAAVGQMLDQAVDVHDAMIALQQADIALQFTVQVRNKIVQAYQDIMRMPV